MQNIETSSGLGQRLEDEIEEELLICRQRDRSKRTRRKWPRVASFGRIQTTPENQHYSNTNGPPSRHKHFTSKQ